MSASGVESTFFFDETELLRQADQLAEQYQTASPFPHIVIDDFLPVDVANALLAEFPDGDDPTWFRIQDHGKTDKLGIADVARMGPITRHVMNELNGGPMVRFVERLTGIGGLVADPHLTGGGLHAALPGGFLDVHADFNVHPILDMERRVNVLLYLNPDWTPEWGGEFELWTSDLKARVRSVAPLFNRVLAFNTTDQSFHGHPVPLACPPGEIRRAIALYYYSVDRPAAEKSAAHSTLYKHGDRALPTSAFAPGAVSAQVPQSLASRVPRALSRRGRAVLGKSRRALARLADAPPTATNPPFANGVPTVHWALLAHWFEQLSEQGRVARPNYTWSLLHVANVARNLGFDRFSALEFGVAGGNGLVALESAADAVQELAGVKVDVHGFDTGIGLPPAVDYRDAPYVMDTGEFAMDETALRARLRRAELHLGLVRDTIGPFAESSPAPVGFVAVDVDYYSSTVDALRLFDADASLFMPRVLAYFDDVLGYPWGESNGERLAIREFNDSHDQRVVDQIPGLRYTLPPSQFQSQWAEQMYLIHILDHPAYAKNEHTSFSTRLDLHQS